MLLVAFTLLAALSPEPGKTVRTSLVESHTNIALRAVQATSDSTLLAALPIPYRGQTPLSIRAVTRPPDKVAQLSIVEDSGDQVLRVAFTALAANESIELDLVTIVVCTSTPPPDGRGVRLATEKEMPPEVRACLKPAQGMSTEDERVRTIAKEISHKDLAHAADDVLGWMRKNIEAGGGPQGVLDVLGRKSANCTGSANLGASLFLAAGIPARILPNVMIGTEQQEHYIVEVWTKELGWSKVETAMKLFPLDDTRHVVLRIAGPQTPRGPGDVPIRLPRGSGVQAHFRYDAKSCFQGARELGNFELDEKDEARIREAARAAFQRLGSEPVSGSRAALADPAPLAKGLGSQARALLEKSSTALQ